MFNRSIKPLLAKALQRSPVVLLNGARQVGKTTLALEFMQENNYTYVTFDDEMIFLAAKSNSSGFINNSTKPIIIDEIQRIPEIFLAIKMDVDTHRVPGRYLLTGSANPLLIPRLGDSLAGRMEIINLMPLSQGEIYNKDEHFIDLVFSDKPLVTPEVIISREDLCNRIITGGYPSVQKLDIEDREAWMREYLNLLLQRDIKDLAQIEKLTEIPNLLKLLAYRASNLLNISEVARDSKLVAKTVQRYIALLETIFLINIQLPWSNNLAVRFIKSPKLYVVDTGLLAYLLDLNLERALKDSVQMGKLLENFVVGELKKQATWAKMFVQLYHFRTSTGEEVDIILENRSGALVGIEIKNSSKVTTEDFKGLVYLQQKVPDKFIKGIVLYTGSQCVPFGNNLYAVPINALWEHM